MKLYFNGCSFTYGNELKDPQKNSWPVLVASSINADFTNDSVNGGTNDRIMYKTILNFRHYDYFFIAWTYYERFTEYNPIDNFEINFNSALNMDPSLHYSDDLKLNRWKYQEYGKLFYKYWFNELYELKKWLQQIILLQAFFQGHDKKYLMLNTANNNLNSWLQPKDKFIESTRHLLKFFDRMDDDQLMLEHQQIQDLCSIIDTEAFVGWGTWCITDLGLAHKCGPNGHILEDGHRAVAKKVLEHYNKVS